MVRNAGPGRSRRSEVDPELVVWNAGPARVQTVIPRHEFQPVDEGAVGLDRPLDADPRLSVRREAGDLPGAARPVDRSDARTLLREVLVAGQGQDGLENGRDRGQWPRCALAHQLNSAQVGGELCSVGSDDLHRHGLLHLVGNT